MERAVNELTMKPAREIPARRNERGFTLVQMLIAFAVIAVVSTIALMGATSASAGQRRVNSARMLSGYLEKARVDSVRRRADGTTDNPLASVTIVDARTYRVFLDFNNTGVPTTRDFTLESGVAFAAEDISAVIAFNWRGRTGTARRLEVFNTAYPNDDQFLTRISISGLGDVSVNEDSNTPEINANTSGFASPTPAPAVSPTPHPTPTPNETPSPTPESGPSPTPIPSPTPSPNPTPEPGPVDDSNPRPNKKPTPEPTPEPDPEGARPPSPSICTISAPGAVSFARNGRSGAFTISYSNANNASINLTSSGAISGLDPALQTVSGSGSFTVTVSYGNGKNDGGTVSVSSPCGNKTVAVSIT